VNFSVPLKYRLADILRSVGYLSWRAGKYRHPNFLILMYHRVVHAGEMEGIPEPGMFVEPETFEWHLSILEELFTVVPLRVIATDEVLRRSGSDGRPVCVLTFDDGWRDFHTNVFPILKSRGMPATVFLPTGFIGTADRFWTDRLGHMFDRIGEGTFDSKEMLPRNPVAERLERLRGDGETKVERAISALKGLPEPDIEEILSVLAARWGGTAPPGRAFLSWEEVGEMAGSGLVTFGSHTAGHRILTTLPEKEIRNELVESRDVLIKKNATDPSFIPFCYPNGNYTGEIMDLVKEAGYGIAVTTENGWNARGENVFCLKRIGVHQDMARTNAMFRCRLFCVM